MQSCRSQFLSSSHVHPIRCTDQRACSHNPRTTHTDSLNCVAHALSGDTRIWPSQVLCCSCRHSVVTAASKRPSGSAANKGFGSPTRSAPSKAATRASQKCPCGSGKQYQLCCGRYHAGALAPTPEALLRARFSAYSLGIIDFLVASTHKENPEHTGDPVTYARSLQRVARATEYISLNIIGQPEARTASSNEVASNNSSSPEPASSCSSSSSDADDEAFLRFSVNWKSKGESGPAHVATETSHFRKVNGSWLYYAAAE